MWGHLWSVGSLLNISKKLLKIWKILWEPFRSCFLNSTANPTQFWWKWAGWAVLFKQATPTIFFIFSAYSFKIFNKETTNSLTFLTHIILVLGVVFGHEKFAVWKRNLQKNYNKVTIIVCVVRIFMNQTLSR